MAGDLVAGIVSGFGDTVGDLKQRALSEANPDMRRVYLRSRLVSASGKMLIDASQVADVGVDGGSSCVVMTLVNVGHSSLAALCSCPGSEEALDVADSVFQSEHAASVQRQPRAEDIVNVFPREVRGQVVAWLAVACDAMTIDDVVFHGTVLTLDRYCAAQREHIVEGSLLRLSLAALCTEIKLAVADDFPPEYWQRLLTHLGQGREQLPDIFRAEAVMLRDLGFMVGVPTPLTFLRGLGMRLHGEGAVSARSDLRMGVARMLTELMLYNVDLQYLYSPVVRAGAAFGAALLAGGPDSPEATLEDLSALHLQLVEDLASYSGSVDCASELRLCEIDLLLLWRDCERGTSPWAGCFRNLAQRYSRPRGSPSHGFPGAGAVVFGAHGPPLQPEAALRHLRHEDSRRTRPAAVSAAVSAAPSRLDLSVLVEVGGRRRVLRLTLSDGDDPRYARSEKPEAMLPSLPQLGPFKIAENRPRALRDVCSCGDEPRYWAIHASC